MPPQKPLILALDTSTPVASVALAGALSGVLHRELSARNHGPTLLPAIEELLGEAGARPSDLDAVVCGRGPGSFTGLRIGLATAKGLSFALGVPLITPSSLEALACALPDDTRLIAPCLDARRQELFMALYHRPAAGEALTERLPATALGPDELVTRLSEIATEAQPAVLLGTGVELYREQLSEALGPLAQLPTDAPTTPDAQVLASLGARLLARGEVADLVSVEPDYIRPSDAEITRDRKLADAAAADAAAADAAAAAVPAKDPA